ncbi:MAG: ATP-binding protein [Bacilli bacterium]
MPIIERNAYLQKLIDYMWDGQVKVITGIRRCGKSFLLKEIFIPYIKQQGASNKEIMFIELDKLSFIQYRNPLFLVEKVKAYASSPEKKYYLFIDEIQNADSIINPYDKAGKKINVFDALNDLMGIQNLDIYVTGSDSVMLSNDILTNFRGRSDEIRVHPLSFSEYSAVFSNLDSKEVFDEYCFFGGMPQIISKKTDSEKMDYLNDLFERTYLKDILERRKIKKPDILSRIIDFLSSSIGSLTNPRKIANTLSSKGYPIESKTISKYLSYLEEAYLFTEAKRYDIKGKSYFDYPSKYYCEDIGLRNARIEFRQQEITHIMENIVFNELKYRGYSVDVGVIEDRHLNSQGEPQKIQREIDFIANKGYQRIYIQSTFSLPTDEKIKSEKTGFLLTKDSFRKVIVRGDINKTWIDDSGIMNIGIIDFLKGNKWE